MTAADRRYAAALRACQDLFGFPSLRPFQEKVVRAACAKRDVFAVASTGSGKTLSFALPALTLPGTAVVVSPLLALMNDHVTKLRKAGVAAARCASDAPRESAEVLRDPSQFNIVFASPEKIISADWRKAWTGVRVSLVALDECHIADKWGKEFRSSYARVADFIAAHEEAVRIACTATADAAVDATVHRMFGLRDPVRVISSPWRENISWKVARDASMADLVKVIADAQSRDGSQVVYCSSRAETEKVRDALVDADLSAAYYHAGMDNAVRTSVQGRFMSGDARCIAATSAFGMGIDKPDIRLVAYWQLPGSLFDLVQGVGRGSRDGAPAVGWVNVGSKAERVQRFLIRMSNPPHNVYVNLWRRFKASANNRWTRTALLRVTGLLNKPFEGQLDAALSFMQFSGCLTVTSAGVEYRLPIRNPAKAAAMARRMGGSIVDGHVVLSVAADDSDNAAAFVSSGACAPAPADEVYVIGTETSDLTVTEDMVTDKVNAADSALESMRDFLWSANKKAFVESYFARAEGAE